jgi:hypothetical protein
VAEVVKTLDNTFWFRKLANVLPPTSQPSIRMPRRSARLQKFAWSQEITAPTADTALKAGGYTLTPHYMTGELQVSVDLLMAAVVNVDEFVRDEIAYTSADTEEDAFCNGDGVRKPTGVFVVNSNGLDATRDVTTTLDQAGLTRRSTRSGRPTSATTRRSGGWPPQLPEDDRPAQEHDERAALAGEPPRQPAGPGPRRADRAVGVRPDRHGASSGTVYASGDYAASWARSGITTSSTRSTWASRWTSASSGGRAWSCTSSAARSTGARGSRRPSSG